MAHDIITPYVPIIKGKGFLPNEVSKFGVPAFADSASYPSVEGTVAHEEWWREQIDRCINGYTTAGTFIPGRYYYYLNFCYISTVKRGNHFPEYVDIDLEFFNLVEHAKKNYKGIIALKARRRGLSFKVMDGVVDHGLRFRPSGYSAGVCAGLDTYSMGFFNKLREANSLKPRELQVHWLKDDESELIAGYKENTDTGWISKGSKNRFMAKTMNKDPNVFKGERFDDVVFEESGENDNLVKGFGATRDCFSVGGRMVGTPYVYGTGGNIKSSSKGFTEMWEDSDSYELIKFEVMGPRLFIGCFGGSRDENGDINEDIPNLQHLTPEQRIGVEDVKRAEEKILEERKRLVTARNKEKYYDYIQNNPLNAREAFLKFSGNSFDAEALNDQRFAIESAKYPMYAKYILEWVKKEDGSIKYPLEVKAEAATELSIEEDCVLIRYHPLPNYKNLDIAGCLLPAEKVMTNKGLMNVEDVTRQEKLINEIGNYVGVNELLRHNVTDENVYDIKVSNTFRTTKFTSEHPILISKHSLKRNKTINEDGFDFSYKKVPEVKIGDWIKVPNVYKKLNDFDISIYWDEHTYHGEYSIIENPLYESDFWWFIGLWLGDGWCESNGNIISFAINIKEIEYSNRLIRVVNDLFNRRVSIRERNGCLEMTFCNKQLSKFITKNFGKYAQGKYIPEWAKRINNECKRHLIQGYLNADGCIGIDKKRSLYNTQFISINLELLESFQDILFSLGYISHLCKLRSASVHYFKNRLKPSKTKECYQLRLNHTETVSLVRRLWDGVDHKLCRVDLNNIKKTKHPLDGCFFDIYLDYIYFQVREIEVSKYTGIVYNFNCETHTFMCHHITTHNCDSYDLDESRVSKSLGGMTVLRRRGHPHKDTEGNSLSQKRIPVCVYRNRPKRKEIFYENCLKISVYYNLVGNTLIDYAKGNIFEYFKRFGGTKYLSPRPKSFESEGSEQMHDYGVSINVRSKPQMIGLVQTWIVDEIDECWFPQLIEELIDYDVAQKVSDWDLADSLGIALMKDADMKRAPSDLSKASEIDPYELPEWKTLSNGKMVDISSQAQNQKLEEIKDPFLRMLESGQL